MGCPDRSRSIRAAATLVVILSVIPTMAFAGQVADEPHASVSSQQQSWSLTGFRDGGFGLLGGSLLTTFTGRVIPIACTTFDVACISPVPLSTTGRLRGSASFESGLFVDGDRSSRIGVVKEILYGQKGTLSGDGSLSVHLAYIEMPVLVRVGLCDGRRPQPIYLIGGPALDLKLSEHANYASTTLHAHNYHAADVIAIGGAGTEVGRYVIEARETLVVRSVFADLAAAHSAIHVRSFALLVGMRLR
jgi:hypothetical protein